MVSRHRLLVAATLLALAVPLAAQEQRPKIGLALSGGGAKGFAHVGVIKVLEEMNVPIDHIAGTSMGAVVGALYASGMSPEESEKSCASIHWNDALDDSTTYSKLVFRRKQDIARYPSTPTPSSITSRWQAWRVIATRLRSGASLPTASSWGSEARRPT